jgi:hypothetical protein
MVPLPQVILIVPGITVESVTGREKSCGMPPSAPGPFPPVPLAPGVLIFAQLAVMAEQNVTRTNTLRQISCMFTHHSDA